jgi:Spy/CpxP family protein refolding chaperone
MYRFLAVLTFCGTLGWSQASGAGAPLPANFDALKAALGLSDDEITRLRELRQQTTDANRSLCEQMAERQRTLRIVSQRPTPDAVEIGQVVVDMINLQKQMESANGGSNAQALAMLTAEQKTKLKALEDAAKLQAAVRQATALNLLTTSPSQP